jgi:hypothetical protein
LRNPDAGEMTGQSRDKNRTNAFNTMQGKSDAWFKEYILKKEVHV